MRCSGQSTGNWTSENETKWYSINVSVSVLVAFSKTIFGCGKGDVDGASTSYATIGGVIGTVVLYV